MPGETVTRFKRWFWRPPRPHGESIPDRTVSSLELFYDLVYVAVVSQAGHHLAEHVSARGFVEFAVVFALIWIAWVNGSIYLELHGREDGRTRSVVFVQMGIVALLAVFTAGATEADGGSFAVVYAALVAVMTWLWYAVNRQDRQERPEYLPITSRYVIGTGASAAVIFATAFLPVDARLAVWAGVALAWMALFLVLVGRSLASQNLDFAPTDSLVERFDLFTIIVLGEVVFGVVNGLSLADRDLKSISTGIIALGLGFGFWWTYFDLIARRLPRNDSQAVAYWILGHFPITLSIAAGGAAMVSLIEHAHDASTPPETAWLVAGSVALGLVAQAATERMLVDADRLATVYRPFGLALVGAAAAALLAGWLRPAPWLLALSLGVILSALWFFAVSRFLRAGVWGND